MLSAHFVHGCGPGVAVVYFCKLVLVLTGRLLVRSLLAGWVYMMLLHRRLFLRAWPGRDAAWSVKAGAVAAMTYY